MSKRKARSVKGTNKLGGAGGGRDYTIPDEHIENLRRQMFNLVRSQMPLVREVLVGKRVWSNQQVNLFKSIMDKCINAMPEGYSEASASAVELDKLSTEQLEAFIASAATHQMRAVTINNEPFEQLPPLTTDVDPITNTLTERAPAPVTRPSPVALANQDDEEMPLYE